MRADPNATAEAIAELEKELAEAGAEAGKGFLTFFAEQATDAEQLARNLANLDAAGLNEAIISNRSQATLMGRHSHKQSLMESPQMVMECWTNSTGKQTRIENAGTAVG